MKKPLILFSVFLAFLAGCCTDKKDANIDKFSSVYKDIKNRYAPDGRSKTFEIRLNKEGNAYVLRGAATEADAKNALIEELKANNIQALDSIVLLPDAKLGEKLYGIATQSVINFNTSGKFSAESATQTLMGTPVRILEKEEGWTRAVTPEGYIAWVTSGSLAEMTKQEYDAYTAAPKVVVTAKYAVITEKPDDKSLMVSDAVWGNILLDLGSAGNYRKVGIADGRTGYLPRNYVQDFGKWLESRNPSPENLVATAKQFIGVPYMWGGTSIKAVDCSGFTKSVYYLNGIILLRDASQQAYTGQDVDISKYVSDKEYTAQALENLRTGDLLFFGTAANGEKAERISHVGMYIGDGVFIHSATKVRINSLLPDASNYYEGSVRLVRAQRILGNEDMGKGIVSIGKSSYMPESGR